jgi:phosphonate transport system substrate-binding protein
MKIRLHFFVLLVSVFYFSVTVAAEYSFGVVPQFEARKLYSIWHPILKVLEHKTGHTFNMVGTESIPSFEEAFLSGSYDFAYMNPWHSLLAYDKQGYVPLVRDDSQRLAGILVVRKDSDIDKVTDLDGKNIAFPSPNALGASLLMRADLTLLQGIHFKPIYVDTHSSVYMNVALKQVSAGGGVEQTLKAQQPEIQNLLKIIYKTRSMAPHPVSAHPRVPKAVMQQVIKAFIAMSQDPEQKLLLEKIPMAKPVEASYEDYKPLKQWGLGELYVQE